MLLFLLQQKLHPLKSVVKKCSLRLSLLALVRQLIIIITTKNSNHAFIYFTVLICSISYASIKCQLKIQIKHNIHFNEDMIPNRLKSKFTTPNTMFSMLTEQQGYCISIFVCLQHNSTLHPLPLCVYEKRSMRCIQIN